MWEGFTEDIPFDTVLVVFGRISAFTEKRGHARQKEDHKHHKKRQVIYDPVVWHMLRR